MTYEEILKTLEDYFCDLLIIQYRQAPENRALIKDYYGREVTNTGKVRTYKEVIDYISKSKKYIFLILHANLLYQLLFYVSLFCTKKYYSIY